VTPYYQDDAVTIWNCDCREILPGLEPADVTITDPPYGVGFRGEAWDAEIPEVATKLPSMFDKVAIIVAPTVQWDFPRPRWVACWARPASSSHAVGGGFNHWSPILLYGDCAMPVDFKSLHAIQHGYGKEGIGHPSPKPEILMRWLVCELSEAGQTVLDPFMGSGTTLRAAKDLGRRAVGIEISEAFCEIAARRMAQEVLFP
jgi:site-specific DNA-methyltransferase (adenine-specific)